MFAVFRSISAGRESGADARHILFYRHNCSINHEARGRNCRCQADESLTISYLILSTAVAATVGRSIREKAAEKWYGKQTVIRVS